LSTPSITERLEKVMSSVTPKLDSCGAEPIHIPGAIQQHGALFVLSARQLAVVQASDNLQDFLDAPLPIGVIPDRENIAVYRGITGLVFR